jgi:hypothetical protein
MSVWEDAFMFGVWAAARVVVDDPKLTGLYGCAGTVWKVNQVDDDRPTSLIVQLDNWVHRVSVRPDQVRRIDP